MKFFNSISTQELSDRFDPHKWVLLDCRTDLQQPDWGYRNFEESHNPGSIYADLNTDLSAPITRTTGRHPLPDPAVFSRKVAEWGINPEVQVVAIDTANGTYAARIWWMLRAIGHTQVAVLDGGFTKWQREGRPVETGIHSPKPTRNNYPPKYHANLFKTTNFIRMNLFDQKFLLLDARAPERYHGKIEPIDPVAGHIPGAINRPTSDNLTVNGTLKSPQVLRTEYLNLLKGVSPEQVIVYCGSGVTSCHNLLAMELAGLHGASLYPGSWSEWIRDFTNPVAKG